MTNGIKLNINAGDKFGKLTIVGEVDKNKFGKRQFEAKCSCDGNIKVYTLNKLMLGHTKSCGCLQKEVIRLKKEKVIGNKYGRIRVVDEIGIGKWRERIVLGECDCNGNIKTYSLSSLRSGNTKSCGCLNKESSNFIFIKNKENVIGNKYGELTIISEVYLDKKGRWVNARCDCNMNVKIYNLSRLKSGVTKSCGCLHFKRITNSKKDYKEKHPLFYKIEKIMDDPNGYGILVRCKKCNEWFKPTVIQINSRLHALERPSGMIEHNFYCSKECKNNCTIFNLRNDPYANTEIIDQQYLSIWREEVLKRQREEYGYNFCEICECKRELHIHHIEPKKLIPEYALDPGNGIVLCKKCHYKYGHKDECSTGKLAYRACL